MLYPVELQGQDLADGAGFEPARPVKAWSLSRGLVSAAHPPVRKSQHADHCAVVWRRRQAGDQDVCGTYAQIARPPPCILML